MKREHAGGLTVGWGGGGPVDAMPCRMSIIRNGNIALSILRKCHVTLTILRKCHVAMSILRKCYVVCHLRIDTSGWGVNFGALFH